MIRQKVNNLLAMDFYDFVNHASAMCAMAKTQLFYRLLFGKIGKRTWIKRPDQIYGAKNVYFGNEVRVEKGAIFYAVRNYSGEKYQGVIKIGDMSFLNKNFNATSAYSIDVGREVAFGTNVFLCDFDHSYEKLDENSIQSSLVSKGGIRIGNKSWIGSNTFVGSGVELGDNCVVAANSVVTKSFPALCVIGGVPAQLIKQYNSLTKKWVRVKTS